MAEAGIGIGLVPNFVASDALEAGRLCEVLKGRVAFQWSILAVYPRRRYLPLRVRAYIGHLAEQIGE
jgi:DNA-binding transcriptional LysR family regulator